MMDASILDQTQLIEGESSEREFSNTVALAQYLDELSYHAIGYPNIIVQMHLRSLPLRYWLHIYLLRRQTFVLVLVG